MRISDLSSDVCSSDLRSPRATCRPAGQRRGNLGVHENTLTTGRPPVLRFTRHRASFLYCGVAPIGLVLASLASPASAQDTQTATPPAADTSAQDTEEAPVQDIVVTGSILKTDTATPSPVTTITVENLDQRGISTTQDAIQ